MNDSKPSQSVARVMLVDDHPHGREGMREILSGDRSFEIIAEAKSGEEALELMEQQQPDLVLMDIRMPGMGGLEATQRIKSRWPAVKIVMVTVSDDIADLFEAIKRGAQGYLLKNITPSQWLEYLRAVAYDEAPMSKELAARLLLEFTGALGQSGRAPTNPLGGSPRPEPRLNVSSTTPLTEREKEILERVAYGDSNREIAATLGISEHTVKNHLKNILQKLHLDNRVQLARYAIQQGMDDRT
ncbi:response regulator transcription factor [Paenibacillus sp. PR3]|uniref:Response regulator transcription factor n=1 Tax=Paenibacillus terricola TaxID=2763503 RepID=A0ABR8MVY0_9BACL|nr:response regulator transcription factor [Paenibacillus terricola]MBD3920117.1 response regulator transcription factor [Paenibacillus terricola]